MTRARLFTIDSLDDEPAKVRPPPPMPTARVFAAESPPVAVASPRTDLELLDTIMSAPTRLTVVESRAFGGMRESMLARRVVALSYAQRSWAQEVAARLGFDVEAPDGWRETHAVVRRNGH
jgi:hypothetical protein